MAPHNQVPVLAKEISTTTAAVCMSRMTGVGDIDTGGAARDLQNLALRVEEETDELGDPVGVVAASPQPLRLATTRKTG